MAGPSKSTTKPPSKPTPSKLPQTHRIRDNQRRSRARRKEYLTSLEAKLNHCERVGVQANVEIQKAARRVLEENGRLKALLRELGVDVSGEGEGRVLEGLLGGGARWGCGGEGKGDVRGAVRMLPRLDGSGGSGTATPTVSSASTMENGGSSSREITVARNLSEPVTAADIGNDIASNEAIDMGEPETLGRDETVTASSSAILPRPKPNCSSCKSVATAIRSIRPDIGTELEEDLGCQPNAGEDCSVPNTTAFDVIDRYSDGRG
ncbi:hypothetical protein PRZ48_014696 [Zasmidium cellare]|uniref:BZIP domain-containing protein n=1 Tax=Zasmidium cellare TaxID=395010 RepID=A0ABR0DZQ4_ZASCE|nr:hypothetical protein PRZ48_014696 [Zasmidium cellare]